MATAQTKEKIANSQSDTAWTEAATKAAHNAVDTLANKAAPAEASVRATATHSAEALTEKQARLQQQIDTSVSSARGLVQKHPLASAGIAFAAGAILVSLFSKRG